MSSCRQEVFLLLRFCICIPAFQGIWYMREDGTVSSYASATISSPCSYASTNLKKLLGYPYPPPPPFGSNPSSLINGIDRWIVESYRFNVIFNRCREFHFFRKAIREKFNRLLREFLFAKLDGKYQSSTIFEKYLSKIWRFFMILSLERVLFFWLDFEEESKLKYRSGIFEERN